jgi:hypothetical protein
LRVRAVGFLDLGGGDATWGNAARFCGGFGGLRWSPTSKFTFYLGLEKTCS